MCCHVKTFENNEGHEYQSAEILIQNIDEEINILEDLPDLDINGEFKEKTEKPTRRGSMPKKLDWPLNVKNKEIFRKMSEEGYNYKNLSNLVPKFDKKKTCQCGYHFDPGCPIENGWIQSKEVKIHSTEFIRSKPRTVYHRPTENQKCIHKDTWTGEDEMLLNIRKLFKDIDKTYLHISTFMQTILHFVIFAKKMFFVMQIITFMQTILHFFIFAKIMQIPA